MHVANRATPVATFTVDAATGKLLGGARLPDFPRHTSAQAVAIARRDPKIHDWLSALRHHDDDRRRGRDLEPLHRALRRRALRRGRPGHRRRHDRQGDGGLHGPAGRMDDGARVQARVRPAHQRPDDLDRALRDLPDRTARLPAPALVAHARPADVARAVDLARVLQRGPGLLVGAPRLPPARLPARAARPHRRAQRAAADRREQPADLAAGGGRDLPDRLPRRARPLQLERHRRRLCGRRRRRSPAERRHAVRDLPDAHRCSLRHRLLGRHVAGLPSGRARRSLREPDRARRHLRPDQLRRLRPGSRPARLDGALGRPALGAHDVHAVRCAVRARPAVRRQTARRLRASAWGWRSPGRPTRSPPSRSSPTRTT